MGSESAGVGSRLAIGKVRVETDGGQGATKVNEDDIIGVVREYIEDKENSYALMLTGEWGCGKTYFVEHALTEKLEEDESRHPVVVASAYGAKDLAELCGAIESGFISKYAIGCAAGGERGQVGFTRRVRQGHGNIVPREKDQGAGEEGGRRSQDGAAECREPHHRPRDPPRHRRRGEVRHGHSRAARGGRPPRRWLQEEGPPRLQRG